MTKKDFELIAKALRAARPPDMVTPTDIATAKWQQWSETVEYVAQELRNISTTFNIATFRDACHK